MKIIKIIGKTGGFAENKDVASKLRFEIDSTLDKGDDIVLDFAGVEAVTQSFMHALISELIRKHGADVLEQISFKSCNDTVKGIINIVVDYMQARDIES